MWDLIVSVPDHCLSFYFTELICPVPEDAIAEVRIRIRIVHW